MNNVNDNQDSQALAELAWRRRLTPSEQKRLRQHLVIHPEAGGRWEADLALTRALNRLPSAPVSSNFTALVLQAVRPASVRRGWRRQFDPASWLPAGWMPRVAMGAAMVCLSFLTVRECQVIQRQKMARELASVGGLAALQPVDWLQNYHTIKSISRVQLADDKLLEVLQ